MVRTYDIFLPSARGLRAALRQPGEHDRVGVQKLLQVDAEEPRVVWSRRPHFLRFVAAAIDGVDGVALPLPRTRESLVRATPM